MSAESEKRIIRNAEKTAQEVYDRADKVFHDLVKQTSISEEKITHIVSSVLKEAFAMDSKRYVDISRVPLLCQSVIGIDKRLQSIEDHMKWGIRIVVGAVLVALLSLIIK